MNFQKSYFAYNPLQEGSILITGATGLLGSHLTKQLLQKNKKIKALYRSESSKIVFKKNDDLVTWVQGDILDIPSLEDAMQNVEAVYHCAALVSFNPKRKNELYKVNVEGTTNVVNACINFGVKKLVHVSSVAALGRIREDIAIDETMNWTQETSNSEYGRTKFLAEMEVQRGIAEGLQAVIVNPVIILGAGDWTKGSSEIFKTVYHEFPWFTDGSTGFVDVDDVAKAMILLMESELNAERFIVSADNKTYQNIFNLIADNFGKKIPKNKVTPFIATLVWRWEALKSLFTGKAPLLTKETAATALAKVNFNNSKMLKALPAFSYTPLEQSVKSICDELIQREKLL